MHCTFAAAANMILQMGERLNFLYDKSSQVCVDVQERKVLAI